MRQRHGTPKAPRALRCAASVALLLSLASCGEETTPSILDPAGPAAESVERLWWPMFWISVVVFGVVAFMLVQAAIRGRRAQEDGVDRKHVAWGEPFIAIAGVFIPVLILGGVFVFSLNKMDAIASGADDSTLTIEVIGRDWWWEVRYPNGAVTANEIHIPTNEPVRVELTTADVIHSFWVPRLQVKTDQIPGEITTSWLEADEPGIYRGQCAEFCGLQHANMVFFVEAQPPDEFDEWLANEATDAASTGSEGEDIFLSASCAGCHSVRGTEADATLGPDLTHLASRRTLAGTVQNTTDNLFDFVKDPHEIKPGVIMPPAELNDDEIAAVVDYLEGLE